LEFSEINLKIFPPIVEFSVITLIGMRTLNSRCFNALDINLSLGALIFSLIIEIYLIKKYGIN